MSKSVFVIDTPKDCLHCKMRAYLHINNEHFQLCGLQIPYYRYGTEAFFKDYNLKDDWISPKCPLISEENLFVILKFIMKLHQLNILLRHMMWMQ